MKSTEKLVSLVLFGALTGLTGNMSLDYLLKHSDVREAAISELTKEKELNRTTYSSAEALTNVVAGNDYLSIFFFGAVAGASAGAMLYVAGRKED